MNTQKIQAAFARKRDADNLRIERSSATNLYFDRWGKITSRYQSWTTPQYYENAAEIVRKSKQQQIKDIQLNERRKKLQTLLFNENQMYQCEMANMIVRKPSAVIKLRNERLSNVSTNVLEKLHNNLLENNDERRRLELEGKLYSRWRHQSGHNEDEYNSGCSASICSDYTNDNSVKGCLNNEIRVESTCRRPLDENSLFESKSDHETMAKLNWLDKQIENQMKREEKTKESEIRSLQLQEEQRKHEEALKERQKIRESEIKELRAIQEYHVQELKQRETETNNLQSNEIYFKNSIDALKLELLKLTDREESLQHNTNLSFHNLTKIKMIFRQRSLYYREELKNDIDRLNRISNIFNCNDADLDQRVIKYTKQLVEENENQSQIQSMYESEAKFNLKKWEKQWQEELFSRQKNLIDLIEKRKSLTEQQLSDNLKQQKQLIGIRETHLSAIANSNDKLKLLINENKNTQSCQGDIITTDLNVLNDDKINNNSARSIKSIETTNNGRNSSIYKRSFGFNWIENNQNQNNNFIDFAGNKLNNCNINDNSQDENGIENNYMPKFGKKKIAWT